MDEKKWNALIPHVQAIALAMLEESGYPCNWVFVRDGIEVKVTLEVSMKDLEQ